MVGLPRILGKHLAEPLSLDQLESVPVREQIANCLEMMCRHSLGTKERLR